MNAYTWHVVETACTTCESGATVAVAPTHLDVARCGPCIVAGKVPTGALRDVPRPPLLVPKQREPEPDEVTESYPEPVHTSRQEWPADFAMPGPVATVQRLALDHGWSVGRSYSRNLTPRVDNGKPGAEGHHVVLRMIHPDSHARCIVHYVVPVRNPSGAKWLSILIVSPTVSPYVGCSITDAKEWIKVAGRALPGWLDGVRHRNLLAAITPKVWEGYHKGATIGEMAKTHEVDKSLIVKIIQDCRAAGRQVPAKGGTKREDTSR